MQLLYLLIKELQQNKLGIEVNSKPSVAGSEPPAISNVPLKSALSIRSNMSNKKMIPCRVCKKLFEPCTTCQTHNNMFRWRNFACSRECENEVP